jgi:pimeloyl-ACP methyl ester carboxylesterase
VSGDPPLAGVDVPGESRFVDTGEVTLHTVQAGPEDGSPVLLLHGFPEFWYCWHEHVRPLANAGHRVVVPDQRGYNRSDKPDGVDAYRIDRLAADIVGILDALDRDAAAVVGHDWGGVVGWWVALHHPDRVRRLCALNAPHPTVFRERFRRSWSQRWRWWYAGFFQVPALPEATLRAGDFRLLTRGLRRSSQPGTFTDSDLDRYREAWSRPGALPAMLNWYRAARNAPDPRADRVRPETLVLWGARDRFLDRSLAYLSVDRCDDGRCQILWDATHWLHHEEPVRVADAVVDFLDDRPGAGRR